MKRFGIILTLIFVAALAGNMTLGAGLCHASDSCHGAATWTGPKPASASDSTAFTHSVSLDVRSGFVTQHHDLFKGVNATGTPINASSSAHLQYAFRFPSTSRLGRIMPSAYQGVGVAPYTFFNHEVMGTPVAFYVFQGAEVARFSESLSLDYEWNFGASAGWHPNLVVGTKVNAYINLGLMLKWQPGSSGSVSGSGSGSAFCRALDGWTFAAGLDMTHFSNGDTMLPNVGTNIIGARITASRSFGGRTGSHGSKAAGSYGSGTDGSAGVYEPAGKTFLQRTELDVILCGSVNAETIKYQDKEYKLDGKFGVAAMHINPLYRLTPCFLVGPAVDIQYNEGINLLDHVAGINPVTDEIRFHRPPLAEQLATGLSLRVELQAPIFSVNLGFGHNIIYKGPELGGFYYLAALKTFVTDSLFMHVGLKVCDTESSNNLLLGLGWRF